MYTYLNQKYGLKSLIIEWAAAIINAVKTYIKDDHDVALFAKILKNECDEDFRLIQAHVKETLINLVKVMLKEKHPLKRENEIKSMLDTIEKGKIEEWMWQRILEKMYEDGDQEILQDRIRDVLAQKSRLSQDEPDPFMNTAKKLTREQLNSRVVDGSK